MTTLDDLHARRAALDAEIKAEERKARAAIISATRQTIAKYGLTSAQLFPARGDIGVSRPVPAKYRDPVSGSTWTGRGKEPAWIRGQLRDQFLIG